MATTLRQKFMQWAYPLLMGVQKKTAGEKILRNAQLIQPVMPLHQLTVVRNNGTQLPLQDFLGKKLLLVNTASDCGYTAQYGELQTLYEQHQEKLMVIGFPANDFKEQEKGGDTDIAQFCTLNFGVQFPLAKKSSVVKGGAQHEVFRWLSDAALNGWNNKAPEWNFSKYLVNEAGVLTHYFPPAVSPLSDKVQAAINHK